jgi:hypothetical protein
MGQDQVALQRCRVFVFDLDAGQFTEAGVNTVNRHVASNRFGDSRSGGFNCVAARQVKRDVGLIVIHLGKVS